MSGTEEDDKHGQTLPSGGGGGGGGVSSPSSSSRRKLLPFRVIVTLVACFLLEFTSGIQYMFGNFLPYITSYLRQRAGSTTVDYSDTFWIGQSSRIAFAVLMPLLGLVLPRLPPRLQFFLGFLAFAVHLFTSYWIIQQSFPALIVCYGFFQGLGKAILYPSSVSLALQWVPGRRRGLVGGVIMAGFGGGALVWNQVVTGWINPHNLQPDLKDHQDLYFTQPEVLSRVPTCFLLLGGIVGSVQLLCILSLVFPPPPPPPPHSSLDVEGTQQTDTLTDNPESTDALHLKDFSEDKTPGNEESEQTNASSCCSPDQQNDLSKDAEASHFRGEDGDEIPRDKKPDISQQAEFHQPGSENPLPSKSAAEHGSRGKNEPQEFFSHAAAISNTDSLSDDAAVTAASATTTTTATFTAAATDEQDVSSGGHESLQFSPEREGRREVREAAERVESYGSSEVSAKEAEGSQTSKDPVGSQSQRSSLKGKEKKKKKKEEEQDDVERIERQPNEGTPRLVDFTPLDLLRSRASWTIFFVYFATELTMIFVVDLHKAYAQTFIHDDHFLAIVASCTAIFNCVGRPVWGGLADRVGFLPTLLSCQALLSVAAATFQLAESLPAAGGSGDGAEPGSGATPRVLYSVWVFAMYWAISGIYSLQPSLTFSLFGPSHFAANLGLIRSSGVVSSLISVFVASAAKDAFGYHGIFLVGAACTLAGMLINVTFFWDCGCALPSHARRILFIGRQPANDVIRVTNDAPKQNDVTSQKGVNQTSA
ncbi:uncharacterized protein LOC143288865 [Babylonia areolata]|uniref:uncharacterized protein LOC143288865 n=1 Tax=Babylonia areolata TaxID=304850 RepID=UPI003FD5C8C3